MVLVLTFKSLIHFEIFSIHGERQESNFICLHVNVQFSHLKRLFSLLLNGLGTHVENHFAAYKSLCLGSLVDLIYLYIHFNSRILTIFEYYSIVVRFKIKLYEYPNFINNFLEVIQGVLRCYNKFSEKFLFPKITQ